MTTNYHTPISNGATASSSTINDPLSELDAEITAHGGRIGTLESEMPNTSGVATEFYNGLGAFTVPSGTGASIDGHIIKDEGISLPQRASVDFVGAGVTVTNEAGGTQVSIPGGGVTDHGALTGLTDDDHPQYLLSSGLRQLDEQVSTPSSPASSKMLLYFKNDEKLYKQNSGGTETEIGAGGGGFNEGFMANGKLSVTVASNNLTVAIKTLAGADPSPSDKVQIRIGGVVRDITSALSVTKNAGTNWCNAGGAVLAAKELDMFVYIIWNTTPATDIIDIGFSRYPNLEIYSDASSTTTNEKYLAYGNASAPNAADNMVVVGRFAATLSASASYNWSVPTYTANNLIQRPIYETRELDFNTVPTNLTAGNGTTNAARYKRFFSDCEVFWKFTLGNTSAVGGAAPYIELPFTASASIPTSNMVSFGEGRYDDAGTATYYGKTDFGAGAQYMRFLVSNAASTYLVASQVNTTVPFTWGDADALSSRIRYPTA